ncbi:MAG TPA: amidase family protein, partial [Thermoleophilaceae bacterium]
RGRVSLAPEFGDFMSGLVAELVVSRSVRDTAAMLEWVCDPPPGEPYVAPARARAYTEEVGADPGRLRIGLLTKPPGGQFEAHPDCVAAAESAGRLLASLGHGVEDSYPDAFDDPDYIPNFLVRWTSGVDYNLKYWERRTGQPIGPDDVEPLTWALAEQGRSHSAAAYLAAMEYAQAISRRGAEWWAGGFDLLLTPTMGIPPTELGAYAHDPDNPLMPIVTATPAAVFTAGLNTTGQPAISLPLHWSDAGLPIGVQLVAAYGREDLLLRVAAQLEQAQPWADRRPPLFAG